MKSSGYTLLVIPRGHREVRKFQIPGGALKLLSLIVIVGVIAVSYVSYKFFDDRGNLEKLSRLETLNKVQKDQIDLLAGKVVNFEERMAELSRFDEKIRVMTNLEGDRDGGKLLGVGGSFPDEGTVKYKVEEMEQVLINEIHKNIDQLLDEATVQEQSFKELLEYLEKQKSILASTPSIWPVMGWVTSEFGYRVSPFTERREFHKGIDIATRLGKEIVAPADGVVAKVLKDKYMGNTIWINHREGISTCYAHLVKKIVKAGQKVKRGDVIGYVGNSGRSTGPHLHYSVMVDGVYVNPRRYLF